MRRRLTRARFTSLLKRVEFADSLSTDDRGKREIFKEVLSEIPHRHITVNSDGDRALIIRVPGGTERNLGNVSYQQNLNTNVYRLLEAIKEFIWQL